MAEFGRSPGRILLVDDEPDIATTLARGLSLQGYSVDAFSDPTAALSNFKAGRYDLAILDVRMPRISGLALYKKLKELDSTLAVCFMTAFETVPEEYDRVFPDGDVRAVIEKPVGIRTLTKIVEDAMRVRPAEGT